MSEAKDSIARTLEDEGWRLLCKANRHRLYGRREERVVIPTDISGHVQQELERKVLAHAGITKHESCVVALLRLLFR